LSDEAAAVTGYYRRYAQALLRKGVPYGGRRLRRGGRPRVYGRAVEQALAVAAAAMGWIRGKRLVAALPDLIPALEREGALRLRAEERDALPGLPQERSGPFMSSRRTGRWCANWSATIATKGLRPWPRSRASMTCCMSV
jgi:hypothetical protein